MVLGRYYGIEIYLYEVLKYEKDLDYGRINNEDLIWLYGWDIPSGAIWNPRAIKDLEYIGEINSIKMYEEVTGKEYVSY